jgi:hypothetical protein
MTKDQMSTLLRGVGCDENTITAMENAYEMGFEYGARAHTHLQGAVEAARDVCKYLDHDMVEQAKDHTEFYWDHVAKLRDMQ